MSATVVLRVHSCLSASGVRKRGRVVWETPVHFKGHKGGVSQEEIHPIPITQEILEQAGFKKKAKTDLFDKFPNEGFTYHLYSHKVMIFHGPHNTLCHWLNTQIDFLHQLQNLYYCLTGRELSVSF